MTSAEQRSERQRAALDAYVQKVVDTAPPLSPAQRDRLAILLHNPAPAAVEQRQAS